MKLHTSLWNKYLVVLAWFSQELQADYVVCQGQEVPLIFLCPTVYLRLISISCVYANSAGMSRRPCTSGSAQVKLCLCLDADYQQDHRAEAQCADLDLTEKVERKVYCIRVQLAASDLIQLMRKWRARLPTTGKSPCFVCVLHYKCSTFHRRRRFHLLGGGVNV